MRMVAVKPVSWNEVFNFALTAVRSAFASSSRVADVCVSLLVATRSVAFG